MRIVARLGAGFISLLALLALATSAALAGGYAEVVLPDGGESPPVAGEEREVRFTLLQHGVTPVDFGHVNLTAVNADTGETITVAAAARGDGAWSATLTFPSAGDWQLKATHDSLETSMPTTVSVTDAGALSWLPAGLSVTIFGLVAMAVVAWMIVARGRDQATRTPAPRPANAEG